MPVIYILGSIQLMPKSEAYQAVLSSNDSSRRVGFLAAGAHLLRQEDKVFKSSLSYMKPCLKRMNSKIRCICFHAPDLKKHFS